jgi:hypothetical protein
VSKNPSIGLRVVSLTTTLVGRAPDWSREARLERDLHLQDQAGHLFKAPAARAE